MTTTFERPMVRMPPVEGITDMLVAPELYDGLQAAIIGGHKVLLYVPAKDNFSLVVGLARRVSGMLHLTVDQREELYDTYAGIFGQAPAEIRPPFRAPHHTVSDMGILDRKHGELVLAKYGALFLDQGMHFRKEVIIRLVDDPRSHDCVVLTSVWGKDIRSEADAERLVWLWSLFPVRLEVSPKTVRIER